MNEEPPKPTPPKAFGVGQGMDYGEQADVQQVHAAVQREKREPRVGAEPLSIWLIAVYGLAVFFGGAYLGRYSGDFSGDALDPYGGEPQTTRKLLTFSLTSEASGGIARARSRPSRSPRCAKSWPLTQSHSLSLIYWQFRRMLSFQVEAAHQQNPAKLQNRASRRNHNGSARK